MPYQNAKRSEDLGAVLETAEGELYVRAVGQKCHVSDSMKIGFAGKQCSLKSAE